MNKHRFIIVPADICNLTCSFCCVAKCEGSSGTVMMSNDAKKYADIIMRYLVTHNTKFLDLQFFGGEPMLNFDAVKIFVSAVTETYKKYRLPEEVFLCLMSNGTQNIPEFIEFVNKCNEEAPVFQTEIQLSYDGPKHLCTESAEKTNIDYLKQAVELTNGNDKWSVCAMLVVSDQNMHNFYNIFKFLYKENILHNIAFRFDIENPNYKQMTEIVIPQMQQIIDYIKEHDIGKIRKNGKHIFNKYVEESPRGGCGSGVTTLCLSADGYLTGCQHDVVLISQRLPNRVYKRLTCVEDIENFTDLSFAEDWYNIGKDGHAEYEDICPSHYEKVKDDPDRKEFFRKVHEIVKQLDEGDKNEEEK